MFNKIKIWSLSAIAFFVAGFSIAFAFFKSLSARKEKNNLVRKIEKQQKYYTEKEKIANETKEKLDKITGNTVSSFDNSVELLHEAANAGN